jgi:hypothetical protein
MLKTKKEIKSWLDKYDIKNYTINEDLTVDVDGDVYLYDMELKSIDIQFNIVSGNFDCSTNELTSLEGCPKEVDGHFICNHNKLTSLEGCPQKVGRNLYCYNNKDLGKLQEITDFNEIKIILNKERLEKIVKDKIYNKKGISKLKI